ncbi:hypothetical protein [Psychrobacter sp. I-STPA6b]|uniref:hypothetical protein n=1 Tax=Psychrobacter sp. I-STPA6b TaxID=2585718 RepID=UPI001D0CD8B0|nr:hypothetical protein [Psychrobacter sp. I-STPA6b]
MFNQRMKYSEIWKIITFFSMGYPEQKQMIGKPSYDYGHFYDRLSDEGNYILQLVKMFLYNTFSDFFPHMKSIPTTNNKFAGSLEELCSFIFEGIYKPFLEIDVLMFEPNELKNSKKWQYVRKLATDGLLEVELYPVGLKRPIEICLPDYMYPAPIYNRQDVF